MAEHEHYEHGGSSGEGDIVGEQQMEPDKDISSSTVPTTEDDTANQQKICDDLEVPECETSPHTVEIPEDIPHFSEEAVQKLAQGVEAKCLPQLEKAKSTLTEINENQRILIETVIQENSKFQESDAMEEVTKTMEKAKVYHQKLVHIKKDMLLLHEKSAKLKKRALKLQQQKQKELLQQEQERERQEERERQLMAQPAKSAGKPKS